MSARGPRTALVLSRHGQTVWHAENRYAGSTDIDLDEVGRALAARLTDWALVHRPAAVVSSPLRRARETAAGSAAALQVGVQVVDAVREVDLGAAEGRTLTELTTSDAPMVARFRADPVTHHFPEGEPTATAAARGATALRLLAAEHEGCSVLVVAHSTLLRLALCELLGLSVHRYRDVFPRLDNGALTQLTVPARDEGPAALISFNVPLSPADVPLPVPDAPGRSRPPTPPLAAARSDGRASSAP